MSRKLLFLLALCAIAAIVAYRASGWDFDWSLFRTSLSDLQFGWLTASVIFSFTSYFMRAVRWQVLLAPLKSIRVAPLLGITIVGFAAIYVLGRAGEFARPVWLARRESVPISGSIATIVVERFLDIIMLTAFFAVALVLVDVSSGSEQTLGMLKNAAWIVSAIAAGGLIALIVIRTNAAGIVRLIRFRRVALWVEHFAQGLSFLQNRKSFAVVIFQTTIVWIAISLQFWTLLRGMSFEFSLGAATLVMVGAGIGSIAQIPGIGGGFQAGYIFGMITLFQIPKEQAIATSLIATVLSYGPTIAVAAIYMLSQGISMRELKSTIRTPESDTV
jgi:uncharacterized protein (TIRG00374 family)